MASNDDDDHKGLISSLRKLFEKNNSVKSLEKILTKVLNRMQKRITTTIAILDL